MERITPLSGQKYANPRRFALLFALLALAASSLSLGMRPRPYADEQIDLVVIDAGHGGKDPGAVGKISYEKDLALSLARKLREHIRQQDSNIQIKLTREDDRFIGLSERAEVANRSGADMFISIHLNASTNPNPYGTETFAMGTHKNNANLELMKRENSVILMEDDYEQDYGGFDPKSEEAYIIFKLQQHAYRKQSLDLAGLIQDRFENQAQRHNRGVKQAGFLVLWRTTMPSVLVEAGFVSNAKEEQYLNTNEGQQALVKAMWGAIQAYKMGQS